MWYQNIRSALFGFVTKHACVRQTNRTGNMRSEIVSFYSCCITRVSKTTLLQKFPEHAVDFIFFFEKVFIVASPVNLQNDRVYAPSNAKKRDIAAERLLRCRRSRCCQSFVALPVTRTCFSRTAHRARETVQLLQQDTSQFISRSVAS